MVVLCPAERKGSEEIKGVIHPAHIPFVIKAQSSVLNLLGGSLVICGVLGTEHGTWVSLLKSLVHGTDKFYRTLIHPSVRITHPVDDTAYGVHSETIKMILLKPVVSCTL